MIGIDPPDGWDWAARDDVLARHVGQWRLCTSGEHYPHHEHQLCYDPWLACPGLAMASQEGTMTDPDVFTDVDAVEQFRNFLAWGVAPLPLVANPGRGRMREDRPVPPAWFAYALGETRWCPPIGEM